MLILVDKASRKIKLTKKVVVDLERLKYPNTGLYTFCDSLAKNFDQIETEDLQLNYYLPANYQPTFSNKISILKNKTWHKYIRPNFKEEIWHVTHQGSNYFSGNPNSKRILTIHDLNFLIEKKNNPLKIKKYKQAVEKIINKCQVITCISDYVKNDVLNNFKVDASKIEVIYNGCELFKVDSIKNPKFIPNNKFYFSIGTILMKKNFHTLLPLIKNSEIDLIIAGKFSNKDYVSRIKREIIELNISNKIHLIEEISTNDKHWYYKNCEAFLFPSIAEGFGLPVIEAMQYGKPIFLSKHTSLPEIGGNVCYYFDDFTEERMLKNLKEGMEHYNNRSSKSKIIERSTLFSWENNAKQYLDIYRNL